MPKNSEVWIISKSLIDLGKARKSHITQILGNTRKLPLKSLKCTASDQAGQEENDTDNP